MRRTISTVARSPRRTVPAVAGAVAGTVGVALALAACKVQPVDGNADLRQPFAMEGTADGATPGTIGGGTLGDGPGGGVRGLGPAARDAVKYLPFGWAPAGAGPRGAADALTKDEVPHPDRWRVGFPAWERGSQTDSPWDKGAWWDPYHQHVLKGDYPIAGTQNTFLVVEAQSVTKFESRKTPTPSGVFTRDAGDEEFFGSSRSRTQEHTLFLTLDLFHGETAFRPVDWRVLVKAAANTNHNVAQENQALFADPSRGRHRDDGFVTLQQAFFETTLASVSPKYDVVQARLGIQQFNSDFRGFIFCDETLGYRLFGNWDDNRWQWNAAWFPRLDKDTNSGLNDLRSARQDVFVANVFRQDVLELLLPRWRAEAWTHGLTSELSFHWLETDPSVLYDANDFLVKPRLVGTVRPTDARVGWVGWTNDGHVDRVNVTSALYRAWGHQDFDEIAGRSVDIGAWLAALELSVDRDWQRFKVFGLWQSGDDDPEDGDAGGFDGIFDNPNFAGGEFGFWNRNAVRLTGSGVGLVQPGSLYNTLRSSKIEGNPAFVNPGLLLLGAGYDAQLTPKLKVVANASYLWFDDVSSVEYVLGQADIDQGIGWDLSVGAIWRPLLTDNVIVRSGVAALVPGPGFRDIYTADTLYSVFVELVLTW